ncbi:DUF1361 domain-containing protein [Acaryochloris sp. IP29b_bin.137]|uniref:DUF1361 domain-containing protein n=1 Tax=Acaryochloris sp. IP29b_bin.137 TaxID=2969217 RepID=UPI002604A2DD|nr:DUF1361 domain-containing protein [Acaryochloris sp. IP29b_bin.137]
MERILGEYLGEFNGYSGWIVWNLFLAFIPMALSFRLFRWSPRSRSLVWWIGLIVFIAFLPNAPYLLTDIIHLIGAARHTRSVWIVTLFFIPLHTFAILAGFEAYVISLINQGHYLKKQGAGQYVKWAEILVHILSAVGIYLGRFIRFNSWDLITNPQNVLLVTLNELTSKFPIVVISITVLVLILFYWIMKQITLGLVLRFRHVRQSNQGLFSDQDLL